MKKMRWLIIYIVLLTALTACAPDPRKEAQAFAIQEAAEQDALNQEQNREHAEEIHDLQIEQMQVEQGHREATAQEWRYGLNQMIRIGFWFATASICYSLFMTARAFSRASTGLANAAVQAAEVRSRLVYLDPETRQFPVILQRIGENIIAACNPNTNSVLLMDVRSEPNAMMIRGSSAVQYAGALASEARKSNDPGGVSIIQTPIIGAGGDHG
jgi:hypothetical protein